MWATCFRCVGFLKGSPLRLRSNIGHHCPTIRPRARACLAQKFQNRERIRAAKERRSADRNRFFLHGNSIKTGKADGLSSQSIASLANKRDARVERRTRSLSPFEFAMIDFVTSCETKIRRLLYTNYELSLRAHPAPVSKVKILCRMNAASFLYPGFSSQLSAAFSAQ